MKPFVLSLVALGACTEGIGASEPDEPAPVEPVREPDPEPQERVDSRPPPMHEPVPLWEGGQTIRQVDARDASESGYIVVDLGEDWTPYLFSERDNREAEVFPNGYRATYLALARGETPDDYHGERARRDVYLELYGIAPTLGLVRTRMQAVRDLECAAALDLEPLRAYTGFKAYENNDRSRAAARRFVANERTVTGLLTEQGASDQTALDETVLSDSERRALRDYRANVGEISAIRAAQDRLVCEGFLERNADFVRGALDWTTHEALAKFERRHRVYGWGFIGGESLAALQRTPLENEREAVLRVLVERAIHAAGVIEDGSAVENGEPATYLGDDGERHPVPNLEADIRERVIAAFGLTTPESTLAWLEGLELEQGREDFVAIAGPDLPPYYASDMNLSVEIDRGDIWYDFPYDAEGNEIPQPVARRPRLTIFTEYNGERLALARFGTTIGGWRSEVVEGVSMWKYKDSPPGPRVWRRIVAAPVWLPPESTPGKDLLARVPGRSGAGAYRVNLHEMGPSYASAYGLVAAYHIHANEQEDGTIEYRGDEGIRTHGSVDYMSIMRRHSHGCHRLHNHIAVRLMSFVLAHHPHRRVGQREISFGRVIEHEGHTYRFDLTNGGYEFELDEPVPVEVLVGRIRGQRGSPIVIPLPKFNTEIGAYVMPDGRTVAVDRFGNITDIVLPPPEVDPLTGTPIDPLALPLPPAPPPGPGTTTQPPAPPRIPQHPPPPGPPPVITNEGTTR